MTSFTLSVAFADRTSGQFQSERIAVIEAEDLGEAKDVASGRIDGLDRIPHAAFLFAADGFTLVSGWDRLKNWVDA